MNKNYSLYTISVNYIPMGTINNHIQHGILRIENEFGLFEKGYSRVNHSFNRNRLVILSYLTQNDKLTEWKVEAERYINQLLVPDSMVTDIINLVTAID